jgi:hypothetical protein
MTGPVTTGAGGVPVEGSGTVAAPAEAAAPAGPSEPIKDLMNRLGLTGTSNQIEAIIRWIAERGAEVLRP